VAALAATAPLQNIERYSGTSVSRLVKAQSTQIHGLSEQKMLEFRRERFVKGLVRQ
jgi:hypothetical protein